MPDGFANAALIQSVHQAVVSEDVHELLGIPERFHVGLCLLKLLRERVDLRNLIPNYFDILREIDGDRCRCRAILNLRNRLIFKAADERVRSRARISSEGSE